MSAKKLFRLFFSFGLALLILVSGTHALASTGYVTKGDVEATLQSWDTGVRAVLFKSGAVAAAQLDGVQRGRIIPAANGAHYCVEDWHVILVAFVTGGGESFTYQDALVDLSGITTTFILDGRTLAMTETPVVRRVVPFLGEIDYGYAVGSILSPADISVGKHSLIFVATFPDDVVKFKSNIYMDAPGTGACAQ